MGDGPQALGREVGSVVVVNLVAEGADVLAALLGQRGQVEDPQSSGVVSGDVIVDVYVLRVFDLVSIYVVLGAIAAHHHVLRLSNVETGVHRAFGDGIFDQHVLAFRGIDGIRTIGGIRTAGPLHAHAPDGDVVAALDGQAVSSGIFDGQVFDDEVVGLDQQTGTALFLSGKRQDALIHAFAANGDLIG